MLAELYNVIGHIFIYYLIYFFYEVLLFFKKELKILEKNKLEKNITNTRFYFVDFCIKYGIVLAILAIIICFIYFICDYVSLSLYIKNHILQKHNM